VVQGGVVVHPFVTLGRGCFIGGPSRVVHDVPPHLMADGHPSRVRGLNLVGARRRGLDRAAFEALREAYRLLIRARMSVTQAAEILESHGHLSVEVRGLIEFIQAVEGGRHGRARDRFRTAAAGSAGEGPEELEETR
jgi:UDP-N-acetylglucosamine acyltransferase